MTFGAIVEIAPGIGGMLHVSELTGAAVARAEDVLSEGAEIVVKVTKINENGRIILSCKGVDAAIPSAPAMALPFDADADLPPVTNYDAVAAPQASAPWQSWRAKKGHDLAVTAMTALRNFSEKYLFELIGLRKKRADAKTQSQKIYESQMQAIRSKLGEQKTKHENTLKANLAGCDVEDNRARSLIIASDTFVSAIPPRLRSARKRALTDQYQCKERFKQIQKLMTQERQAFKTLCEALIAEAEREANDKGNTARQEQIARDAAADREYQEKKTIAHMRYRTDIAAGMSQRDVKSYTQLALSSRFNAERYDCPPNIPEHVMLGNLCIALQGENEDFIDVVQAVETQMPAISKNGNSSVFGVPYCQKLDDGISLLVRYTPQDRSAVQSMIHPLLLKLFMLFPAGRLEATMIDPLELGASFCDIPKLAEAPNASRIIDTKVWSKDRDIENAIGTLRQRLENMTQSYGGDKESRLRKEVIRVLAITDFPTGFSEAALKDLRAIVRNSASLGVCVMIWSNDFELENLKKRSGPLVEEITQCLLETKAAGKRLMLQQKEYERLFLSLDDMSDALANKDQIMKIICDSIDRMQVKVEHFGNMFDEDIEDSNNWFMGNHSEIAVPVGIRGANTVVKMVLGRSGGSTEHHVLIAGQTGAGKSTLLHTMIMSTMINYSPDEVQMYLVDFKEGVGFKPYTRYRLPSLRVVAIDSEREFGLNILKELCSELETRADMFSRKGVEDINDYSALPDIDTKVPKLLLIFDEVQELFRSGPESDGISSECLSCLNKLIMQGRALGIHIILACQDFNHCSGLETLFSQMAVRIAVKGSEASAASILSNDNPGIRTLQNQPAGSAIYNGGGGVEPSNVFYQVSYMNKQERTDMLARFDAYFTDYAVAEQYKEYKTRILLTNAEDDVYNCFNTLIIEGMNSVQPLTKSRDAYGLLLGQGFGRKNTFVTELSVVDRDNLLIVGKEERRAQGMFIFTAMSVLYEELHTAHDKCNTLVYVLDLSADELTDDLCDFNYLKAQFPDQIEIAGVGDVDSLISAIYETLKERTEKRAPDNERIFLLLFGINRARRLRSGSIYDEDNSGEQTSLEKLQEILKRGPRYHINSVVWGESLRAIENILGPRYETFFDKRIAYGLDDADMDLLVAESHAKSLRSNTVVYMDIGREVKNTHFRPYNLPAKVWIESYGQAYNEIVNEEEGE